MRLAALVLLAACRGAAPEPEAPEPDRPATPVVAPVAGEPDAAPEPEARAEPLEVLSGTQAEQVIASSVATPPPRPEGDGWLVAPTGLGPVRLGMSRAELALSLTEAKLGRVRWQKIPQPGARAGPMAPPSLELAEVFDAKNARMLRVRVHGGRVASVVTGYFDPRLVTEHGVGVGTTFEAALDAHGSARPVTVVVAGERLAGWVLEDLPGVILVPPPGTPGDVPAAEAKIVAIAVVGPEAD